MPSILDSQYNNFLTKVCKDIYNTPSGKMLNYSEHRYQTTEEVWRGLYDIVDDVEEPILWIQVMENDYARELIEREWSEPT